MAYKRLEDHVFKWPAVTGGMIRLVLHKGQVTATGSTATSYAWFVWNKIQPDRPEQTRFVWIPP